MKKIFIFMFSFLLFSCSALDKFFTLPFEKQKIIIEKDFKNLEEDFFVLLENKIKESKREKLEKKFKLLKNKILKVKNIKSEEDKEFIKKYFRLTEIKLQYLEDLK